VVIHVLEYETSLDVHSLVVGQFALNFRKHSQGLAEVVCSSEHQAKVEHRAYEIFVAAQCLLIKINCLGY